MEAQLRAIQTVIAKAENDIRILMTSLISVSGRWKSVQSAFDSESLEMESIALISGLRAKIELEQMSACDTVLASMNQSVLMLEHAVTDARGRYVKAGQALKAKALAEGWLFPPTQASLGDMWAETGRVIDRASDSVERFRWNMFKVNSTEDGLSPDAITAFVSAVDAV